MSWPRIANSLFILVLSSVVAASLIQQILGYQLPCAYCILQRNLMLITASCAAMNLCFGLHIRFYAMALFSSILGAAIALRQIALHACPSFPLFGNPVLGLSLYTWSFLVFCCSGLAIAILLYFHSPEHETSPSLNALEKTACSLLFATAACLVLLTFYQCGFGDCSGKANAAKYVHRPWMNN